MRSCPVRYQKNGDYYTLCWRDSEGNVRTRGGGPVTQSAATMRRKCFELATELSATPASRDAKGRLSVSAWGVRYVELRGDSLSDGGAENTQQTLDKLVDYLGEGKRLAKVSRGDISAWITWLRKQPSRFGGTLSENTVSKHTKRARAIFALAVRDGEIGANPVDGLVVPEPEVKDDWAVVPIITLEAILAACPNHQWRCLFALCRLAGTRVGKRGGEALGLAWKDVDWQAGTLLVVDQKRGKNRLVPIQPRLRAVLEAAYAANPAGPVCPQLTHWALYDGAHAILRAAGVPPYAKVFHDLRKNLESEWLNDPRYPLPAVCGWLGNSPDVAMKHYHRRGEAAAVALVTQSAHNPAPSNP